MIRYILIPGLVVVACIFGMIDRVAASNYSSGTYGSCQYGSCSISLASEPTVAIDITPSGGTRCTIQRNLVTAVTDSSTGYTVTINNADTSTTLDGPSAQTIPSVTGTQLSPVALSANRWGYRIDGVASFGAGPTSVVTNVGIPALTFAAVPSSAAAGGTIRYTASLDPVETSTSVWYGLCVNATPGAGVYTDNVIYTAVIN